MKQKIAAFILLAAMTVCAVSVLADETEAPAEVPYTPDAAGTVTYTNLERRIRENSAQYLAIEEQIQVIESIDYKELEDDLRDEMNNYASQQWGLITMPPIMGGGTYATISGAAQLGQIYDALEEKFDAIRDGEMQEDNAALVRQMRDLENQIVLAGEALYTALLGMETQEAALTRQLEALDRTVEEMELRHSMGQISALQLAQTKSGRSELASGLETLRMNIHIYKLQLETLIGENQTGRITLGDMPIVSDVDLDAMDVEKDLVAAKAASYELYAAERTLQDAKDTYQDVEYQKYSTPQSSEYLQAEHTWNSAQYTYRGTVENYEVSFRTLHAQTLDCRQIVEKAGVALEVERTAFRAAELKYEQGVISKNAYLAAKDSLQTAEEALRTAENELFSNYNAYCWAVETGILS